METEFQERCPGIGRGGGVGGNCYWSSNETIRLTDLDRNEGNPSLLGEEGVRVETVRRSVLPFLPMSISGACRIDVKLSGIEKRAAPILNLVLWSPIAWSRNEAGTSMTAPSPSVQNTGPSPPPSTDDTYIEKKRQRRQRKKAKQTSMVNPALPSTLPPPEDLWPSTGEGDELQWEQAARTRVTDAARLPMWRQWTSLFSSTCPSTSSTPSPLLTSTALDLTLLSTITHPCASPEAASTLRALLTALTRPGSTARQVAINLADAIDHFSAAALFSTTRSDSSSPPPIPHVHLARGEPITLLPTLPPSSSSAPSSLSSVLPIAAWSDAVRSLSGALRARALADLREREEQEDTTVMRTKKHQHPSTHRPHHHQQQQLQQRPPPHDSALVVAPSILESRLARLEEESATQVPSLRELIDLSASMAVRLSHHPRLQGLSAPSPSSTPTRTAAEKSEAYRQRVILALRTHVDEWEEYARESEVGAPEQVPAAAVGKKKKSRNSRRKMKDQKDETKMIDGGGGGGDDDAEGGEKRMGDQPETFAPSWSTGSSSTTTTPHQHPHPHPHPHQHQIQHMICEVARLDEETANIKTEEAELRARLETLRVRRRETTHQRQETQRVLTALQADEERLAKDPDFRATRAAQHAQIYTQTRDLLRRALAAAEAANDALATTTLRPHPSPRDIPTQPSPASLSGPKPSTAARPPPPSPCPRGRTTPPVPVHGSQTTKTLDADDEDAAWAHPAASLLRVVESHVTARGRELDVTLSSLVETCGRLVTARITAARMSARLEAESASASALASEKKEEKMVAAATVAPLARQRHLIAELEKRLDVLRVRAVAARDGAQQVAMPSASMIGGLPLGVTRMLQALQERAGEADRLVGAVLRPPPASGGVAGATGAGKELEAWGKNLVPLVVGPTKTERTGTGTGTGSGTEIQDTAKKGGILGRV